MNVFTNDIIEGMYLTLTDKFIKDDYIIEDYIKYIDYFNKQFEITNNKEDEYIYDDLLNEFYTYTDINELFDFYLTFDLDKIFQIYFDLLNKVYKNVNIHYKTCNIYGIKKEMNYNLDILIIWFN